MTQQVSWLTDQRFKKEEIIKNIDQVPPGGIYVYLEELEGFDHEKFRGFVALYQRGNTGMNILMLVAENAPESVRLEILSRVKKNFRGARIDIRNATKEVIASIHAMNKEIDGDEQALSQVEEEVNALLERAIAQNASDIHIETRGPYADVLMRIYKKRYKQDDVISRDTAMSFARVMYMRGDASSKQTDWTEKDVRDTSFDYESLSGESVQVRFHSAPIAPFGNFQVVLRLLYQKRVPDLKKIGYTSKQIRALEDMIVGSQGLILFVGPTNSGKSTSLRSIIERIMDKRGRTIKVVTVEDPVEYVIDGACQMGVSRGRKNLKDEESNSVYYTLLKATLRQDPDIVMLGEIRDTETARTIKDLALAGHKILSTLHAFEAMAAFPRLREIGLEENLLFMPGFISGVVYQRLVPTLCPHCSVPLQEAIERHKAGDDSVYVDLEGTIANLSSKIDIEDPNCKVRIQNQHGCEHCGYKGVNGMTICAEIVRPDEEFLRLMSEGRLIDARNHWMEQEDLMVGGFGVRAVHHGVYKVDQGLIDPHDLEKHVGRIE